MSGPSEAVDVAVLGGGPAGYVAALVAARRGARVTLIERQRVGGTCLNIGCIPTKALATSADMLVRCRRAQEFGLFLPKVSADIPALMTYKQASVDQLVGGVEHLLRERRVTVVSGEARFDRPGLLSVMQTGRRFEIAANHIVLAPGSLPSEPPIEGCDLPNVITSTEALTFDMVPARLVVVGGGVIGLEFVLHLRGAWFKGDRLGDGSEPAARRDGRRSRQASPADTEASRTIDSNKRRGGENRKRWGYAQGLRRREGLRRRQGPDCRRTTAKHLRHQFQKPRVAHVQLGDRGG